MTRLQQCSMAAFAMIALAFVAVAHLFINPGDTPTLTVCVEWIGGFTQHLDGISLLAAPPAVAAVSQGGEAQDDTPPTEEQRAGPVIQLTEEQFQRMMDTTPTQDDLNEAAQRLAKQDQQRTTTGVPDFRAPSVTSDPAESDGAMALETLRMLNAQYTRDPLGVRAAQHQLALGGHFGKEVQERATAYQRGERGAGDYYSTLVDADGGILLPTVVASGVEEVGNVYGVARRICRLYNHIVGKLKVPGASGSLPAGFVGEGGEIASSKRAFQAIELNPKKVAVIVPWTYEAALEAAPQIMQDLQRALGRSFAKAEDDALFNGDGSADYNSIDGILSASRTDVANYVMEAGDTSFDDLDANDIFFMRRKIPAAAREGAVYVFHPDMEPKLRTFKDEDGSRIYAFNSNTGVTTLGGKPVYYTEVLPAIDADAANTTFGVFGNFEYIKLGLGQGITTEELREATVKDADTGANINLATQDMRALKAREFFDLDCNFENVFCEIKTAAA